VELKTPRFSTAIGSNLYARILRRPAGREAKAEARKSEAEDEAE